MVTVANMITEYRGLSTDTKPTDARNGDTFIEIDTGIVFIYDAESQAWLQFPPAQKEGESNNENS